MLNGLIKHFLHCCLFAFVILVFELPVGGNQKQQTPFEDDVDPIHVYGIVTSIILYVLYLAPLLWLPTSLAAGLGLVLYNCFLEDIKLKAPVSKAPFICVRVVTRGEYPELVRRNVILHVNTCLAVGLKNFVVEVVTQKAIYLSANSHVREVLVPESYRTKSGALFKARNLQYCLEEGINKLKDDDWILHLDENSVRGVLNFIADGRYQFGQGLITFANQNFKNWLTTFADNVRVTASMGILRFQFKMFHKPLWGMMGSFFLALAGAERKVSFDHGIDGSITEDTYVSTMAFRDGYQFDFIEGDMWEDSPLTVHDLIQQRKRWMQGHYWVIKSDKIPMRNKLFLVLHRCAMLSGPLTLLNYILAYFIPLPRLQFVNFATNYVKAVHFYSYLFGFLKSFHSQCLGYRKIALYALGSITLIPVYMCFEQIAIILAMFGENHQFYVVKKAQ